MLTRGPRVVHDRNEALRLADCGDHGLASNANSMTPPKNSWLAKIRRPTTIEHAWSGPRQANPRSQPGTLMATIRRKLCNTSSTFFLTLYVLEFMVAGHSLGTNTQSAPLRGEL